MNNELPKEFIEGDIVGMMHYIFRKMNEISSRLDSLEERATLRVWTNITCRPTGEYWEYTYASRPRTNLWDYMWDLTYEARDGTYTINTNI